MSWRIDRSGGQEENRVSFSDPMAGRSISLFTFCGFAALAPLLSSLTSYGQGRECKWSLGFLLPVSFWIYLVAFACFVAASWLVARDLMKRHKVGKTAFLLIAGVAFVLLNRNLAPPVEWFLRGFHDGIAARVSESRLKQIAERAREIVPSGKSLWSPAKAYGDMEADSLAKWPKLEEAGLQGLRTEYLIVSNHDGVIELMWGGALTGHWGLRISPDGKATGDADDVASLSVYKGVTAYYGKY